MKTETTTIIGMKAKRQHNHIKSPDVGLGKSNAYPATSLSEKN
jgi:hypothetical protein